MALHYLDGDGTKACGPCTGSGRRRPRKERGARVCVTCHGAGRIADPEAYRCNTILDRTGWYVQDDPARFVGPLAGRPEPRVIGYMGPFKTEAAALEAARRELRGGEGGK